MPTGPQGQKRSADVIGCAVQVARISVGDVNEELVPPSGKVRSGQAGAFARQQNTTVEERAAIARQGAAIRWSKRA